MLVPFIKTNVRGELGGPHIHIHTHQFELFHRHAYTRVSKATLKSRARERVLLPRDNARDGCIGEPGPWPGPAGFAAGRQPGDGNRHRESRRARVSRPSARGGRSTPWDDDDDDDDDEPGLRPGPPREREEATIIFHRQKRKGRMPFISPGSVGSHVVGAAACDTSITGLPHRRRWRWYAPGIRVYMDVLYTGYSPLPSLPASYITDISSWAIVLLYWYFCYCWIKCATMHPAVHYSATRRALLRVCFSPFLHFFFLHFPPPLMWAAPSFASVIVFFFTIDSTIFVEHTVKMIIARWLKDDFVKEKIFRRVHLRISFFFWILLIRAQSTYMSCIQLYFAQQRAH